MKKIVLAMLTLAVGAAPAVGAGYNLLNVGIDFFNQERYTEAITWLDKAIAAGDLSPDQLHVAHMDRGIAYSQTDQPEKAITDFDAAIAIRPDDALTIENRAFAYVAADHPDKALLDLVALKKSAPDNVSFDIARGLVDWQLGRYDDAAAAFSPMAEYGYYSAWLWLQLANIKQGKPVTIYSVRVPSGGGIYRQGIPYDWPGPLMSFYFGNQSEDDVLNAVNGKSESEASVCEANFYLAEWHLVHGDSAGAKSMMQKAAEDCPRNYIEWRMAKFELKNLL
jgi:lipoprotein NlpI